MATEITMPKLSDTMTEGKLVSWKKSVGERVSRGDIIAEVETDKANMELESFSSGVLLETRAKPGDMVAVGTVIATVGEAGEKPSEKPSEEPSEKREEEPQKPSKGEAAEKEEEGHEPPVAEAKPPRVPEAPYSAAPEPQTRISPEVKPEMTAGEAKEKEGAPPAAGRPVVERAAPVVRRLAREKGIDLSEVQGTGPDGRISMEDLERHLEEKRPAPQGAVKEEKKVPPPQPGEVRPLSRMRAAIARTVAQSWRDIPHFTVTVEVDMEEVEHLIRGFKTAGEPVSLNDMIIKATAVVLARYPQLNSSFSGEGMAIHPEINIGFALSVEEGLLVPVIKDCRDKMVKMIAARTRELIQKGRSGQIAEQDLSGGTFTVSNLGMFGVHEFSAIIMPPQVGILAVGGVNDLPVVRNGALAHGRLMRATLSADHRAVDGAYAAKFMAELKKVLENPVVLLV